jgi:hypothetical protein
MTAPIGWNEMRTRAIAISLGIERFTDRHWQNLEEQLVPDERRIAIIFPTIFRLVRKSDENTQ